MKTKMKLLFICALASAVGILAGCSGGGGTPPVPRAWTVRLLDTFTRADTAPGTFDLGSTDWAVDPGTSSAGLSAFMVILANEAKSDHGNGGAGVAAAFTGSVDYASPMRTTVKFQVEGNGATDTWCGLFVNLQPVTYGQYFLQVNSSGISVGEHDGTAVVGTPSSAACTLAYDTWYVMQLESNGIAITGRVYDATGTTLLATATYTETSGRTYTTGSIGFYNCVTLGGLAYDEYVWFDDFLYESYI